MACISCIVYVSQRRLIARQVRVGEKGAKAWIMDGDTMTLMCERLPILQVSILSCSCAVFYCVWSNACVRARVAACRTLRACISACWSCAPRLSSGDADRCGKRRGEQADSLCGWQDALRAIAQELMQWERNGDSGSVGAQGFLHI